MSKRSMLVATLSAALVLGGAAGGLAASSAAAAVAATRVTVEGTSPGKGNVGTTVNILGRGFKTATSATIHGVALTNFKVLSDTSISGTVAAGTPAGAGAVTVVAPGGSGTAPKTFLVGG